MCCSRNLVDLMMEFLHPYTNSVNLGHKLRKECERCDKAMADARTALDQAISQPAVSGGQACPR